MLRLLRAVLRPDAAVTEGAVRPARDVLTAERDGLAVLLDLRRSVYLGLDEVGTTAWRALEGGATSAAVAACVSDEYDVPPEVALDDIRRFIDDLRHRRLVVPA